MRSVSVVMLQTWQIQAKTRAAFDELLVIDERT